MPGEPVYLGYDDGYEWPSSLGVYQVRSDGLVYRFDELYQTRVLADDLCLELEGRPWFRDLELGWADPTARAAIETFRRFFLAKLGRAVMLPAENDRVAGWKAVRGRLGRPGKAPMIGFAPQAPSGFQDLKGLVRRDDLPDDCEKKQDHGADEVRYLIMGLHRHLGLTDRSGERPTGSDVYQEDARAGQAERKIREYYDRLRRLGVPAQKLDTIEQFALAPEGLGAVGREAVWRAYGALLSELTVGGRLARAGLRLDTMDDDDEMDRPD